MVRKKTDPFWKHVEVCQNTNRWKCKFCDKEYPGHASRIKAHLGQVRNRGIEICDKVDERVKEEALTALGKEAPDKQQNIHMAEETTEWVDRGIGSENNPDVYLAPDYNLLEDYRPVNNYNHHSSGEASHLVLPEASSVPLQNIELNIAMLHAQPQQADPLPSSYFRQQNDVNTMTGTSPDQQMQNINELGADEHVLSICTEFDQRLLTLKRKLKCLSNQKEEMEEELYQRSKKVKTIRRAYQKMKEASREGNHPSLGQLYQVKELINQLEELSNLDFFENETSKVAPSSKATPLLTSKLIGRDEEKSEIWDSLVNDGVLRVSIYGMGGVGKTEIMMNIYNELLNEKAFDNVFWVTVPKDFSVYELQGAIGNAVHLEELSNEKDEKIRAAMLYRFLTSRKKYIIILDGLWRYFNYYDIGIPLKCNGLKLVIACRSLDVSRMMLCQRKIKIRPFVCYPMYSSNRFDWELFMHELNVETELPEEVAKIAQRIVVACNGLPLHIRAIATRMREVENVQKWSDMMEKLNDSKERLHELKGPALDQLKLSYERLNNHELQQCLIFCAFFYKSRPYATVREVKEFLIDVGLLDESKSRTKVLHRVQNNLEELENACLLNFDKENKVIRMHEAIIDMALHVAMDSNLFKFDIGIGSLHEELQTKDLNEVMLMRDATDEISKLSPNGIRLPILVNRNYHLLRMIPNSVFIVFAELKILNLSKSCIKELPDSLSNLIRLTALILQECYCLHHIPNMEKLTSLRKLDLHRCKNVKDLPNGFEYLVNLEYLDLKETGIVFLSEGASRTLKKLQYLSGNFVRARELEGLAKLEWLCCRFSTLEDLTIFLNSFSQGRHGEVEYFIFVGTSVGEMEIEWYERYKGGIVLKEVIDMERDVIFLTKNFSDCPELKNLEDLQIVDCKTFRVIFGEAEDARYVTSNDGKSHITFALRRLSIKYCPEFKYIIAPRPKTRCSFPTLQEIEIIGCSQFQKIPLAHVAFPCLEMICIENCYELEEIIATSSLEMPHPTSTPTLAPIPTHFSHLTSLTICHCHKMKRLLNRDILLYLSNLQHISVSECIKMEELTNTYDEHTGDLCTVTRLPNLKKLELSFLPELSSIGAIALAYPIESISVYRCPKIKMIPLQMQQLSNGVGTTTPPSSLKEIVIAEDEIEWWASLHWEPLEAKNALQPYLRILEHISMKYLWPESNLINPLGTTFMP